MGGIHREHALFLQLLGEVRLWAEGRDLCPRGRKARALLVHLAVSPARQATRERLADLLWTDRGAEQSRGSLRQAIAEVRRCAPERPLLEVGRERVGLDGDAVATDLEAIAGAVAGDADGRELARLMADVRGGFADGLDGLSPGWDEWLAAERHQQHERLVSGVLRAAGDMIGRAEPGDIGTILRGLDRLDPLNEAVARLGMRVDAANDDRASLHRRYRRLEEGLRREFGESPSAETRDLFATLTAFAAPAADRATASVAPSPDEVVPTPPPAAVPPTIIVTPLAADPQGEEADLAAICTDDIRVALTRLPDIRVIMLDGADAERVDRVCAGAVGVYMLSGRLRRLGDDVRVNLQLGNVHSQLILWSEQLRLGQGDLLDAVDRVVERAAGAVLPSIERDLPAALAGHDGEADVALLYMRARLAIRNARTADEAERGCALLEQVIERDAKHVRALLLLARMHNTDYWQMAAGHDVPAFRARARSLCEQAAAIEPNAVELTLMRAWCDLRARDWRAAATGFERALRSLPHDADTTNLCAFGLCHLGDLDQADALMQRAFRLNPFPPGDYHADRAVLLALRGRAEEAEEHFTVSGEHGLQYLAVRIANLTTTDPKAAVPLRARFAAGFRIAWRGARPPGPPDLARWVDDTVPLKREEHRRFLQEGVTGALG